MKRRIYLLLLIFFCGNLLAGSSYRKIVIPFNNQIGVPFSINDGNYTVCGFTVDEDENLYFLDGLKTTLAIFKGKTQILRKPLSEIKMGILTVNNDSLYVLNSWQNPNILYVLSRTSGKTCTRFRFETKGIANSCRFVENKIILEMYNNSNYYYNLFSLSGIFLGKGQNIYNLAMCLYPKSFDENGVQYIGKWKDGFVFYNIDFDEDNLADFVLTDKEGNLIKKVKINYSLIGYPLCGYTECDPSEHKVLRGDNLYILRRIDKNAVVIIIPLGELF